VAVAASLGFLIGGILWPGIAESLLRILLAALALGWVAARGLGTGLPAATVHDTYSPFDATLADLSPPATPDVVWRRARALAAADEPRRSDPRPIPWPVARGLIHEALRRLEGGHGLRFDRPADAARIRRMVSEATWALLGQGDLSSDRDLVGVTYRPIPLTRLDDILDDLERL
jgi:hypothetical protein